VSVYVDRARNGYGRMIMCHMIADTPDELHAMADRIGVARRWFQTPPKASMWHYDIAQSKRTLAIEAGAICCDRNTFVDAVRRIRASGAFAARANTRGKDPCPKCGTELADAPGGGVKCPACPYWFCY
jgi:hypothetical protein